MKLYIFRHGETYQTKNNINYTPDNYLTSPLLPEGIPTIQAIGRFLKSIKTDANYVSPVMRCIQTAEIVSEISGKNFFPHENLTEYAEWMETFESLRTRVEKFIDYLREQKIESTSICTHGAVISALKHLLTDGKYIPQDLTDYPRPGVVLIIKEGTSEEIDFNI